MVTNNRHPSDPRPDKTEDHQTWEDILWNAWHWEQPLYFLLHGIRCGGAEIMRTENSFMLLPGEWSDTEWEDIKQNRLASFRQPLIDVFKMTRIGRHSDVEIPKQFLTDSKPGSLKYAWMR